MWTRLETRLIDWEKRFSAIWLKKVQERLDIDHKFVARELPLLKAEKRLAEMRLRKIEELIAKTRILLDDFDEDLCRELSGGHTLSAAGEALLKEFGPQLKEDHGKGRETCRKFFEKHYKISKAASRDLFSLLEEVGTLFYQVEIPDNLKDGSLMYYASEIDFCSGADFATIYNLNGWWKIRA